MSTKNTRQKKGTNSAGVSTSPLSPAEPVDPALAAPASAIAPAPATAPAPAPAPAVAPASAKPWSAATALIEKDIEGTLVSFQSAEEALEALETELGDLKERFPRQYREVSDRLGIDIEETDKPKNFDFSNLQIGTSILWILIVIVGVALIVSWWNKTPNAALSAAQPAAIVEAVQIQFELLPTATMGSEVGMIIIPTSTIEAVATATAEATAVPTAIPPTAVPPTAIPPTAIPPTAVPLPIFWNSNEFRVFEVGADGAVCSGDKVAGVSGDEVDGVKGPVTIAFPPNYGNVEVVWGRCVVNGGTAQQIADEDTKNHEKQFVVKEAP